MVLWMTTLYLGPAIHKTARSNAVELPLLIFLIIETDQMFFLVLLFIPYKCH